MSIEELVKAIGMMSQQGRQRFVKDITARLARFGTNNYEDCRLVDELQAVAEFYLTEKVRLAKLLEGSEPVALIAIGLHTCRFEPLSGRRLANGHLFVNGAESREQVIARSLEDSDLRFFETIDEAADWAMRSLYVCINSTNSKTQIKDIENRIQIITTAVKTWVN